MVLTQEFKGTEIWIHFSVYNYVFLFVLCCCITYFCQFVYLCVRANL